MTRGQRSLCNSKKSLFQKIKSLPMHQTWDLILTSLKHFRNWNLEATCSHSSSSLFLLLYLSFPPQSLQNKSEPPKTIKIQGLWAIGATLEIHGGLGFSRKPTRYCSSQKGLSTGHFFKEDFWGSLWGLTSESMPGLETGRFNYGTRSSQKVF